jgi:hypothetical protein
VSSIDPDEVGRDHPRQHHGPSRRGRLLQGDGSASGGCRRAGLLRGDRAGRADVTAVHHRQERARRPAGRQGEAQPGRGADDRQPGCRVGRAHRSVEIKDVSLPGTMKRSMSRRAEAERERRARIITADGELQALREARAGGRGHGRASGCSAAATASDGGRGCCREELHARAPLPGRATSLLGEGHPSQATRAETPRSLDLPADPVDGPPWPPSRW